MKKELLLANVQAAKREVGEAEAQLAALLHDLQGGSRAEKTTISAVLSTAFDKLGSARKQLLVLEDLAQDDDD